MKNKLIILSGLVAILAFSSCRKDLTSINENPKRPQSVPSYTLVTNAERVLSNTVTSSNVNLNIFRLIEQYWQETTYTDESNYDIVTRSIPDNVWRNFYRDILENLYQAKVLMQTDVLDEGVRANQTAIADILQVYSYYYLLITYGNIPYTEANTDGNLFPVYDDQHDVYNNLLQRLDSDIQALNPDNGSFGSADIIYNGDVAAWLKFANSFKLKLAMLVADVDPSTAKTAAEAAVAAGVFDSNADNALFHYLSAPPNTNPVWVDLVQSGRKDFVACKTVVDYMESLGDPRMPYYFTMDASGGYSGGAPGASSSYATFSKPAVALTAPDFPADLLDYSEVEFLLAEAVERGMNVGETAESHYNKAIQASIEYWGGSPAEAAAYLANPEIAYSTAPGNWKQKIGMQKWLALYNRGYDAWIDSRRFDYPQFVAPADAASDFPVRFTYPVNEQNTNGINYDAAAAAIGGDAVTTKLFWDVN